MKTIRRFWTMVTLAGLLFPVAICHAAEDASPPVMSSRIEGDTAVGPVVFPQIHRTKTAVGLQVGLADARHRKLVPVSLTEAAESGEGVYDAARANTWQQAEERLKALKSALQEISNTHHSAATVKLEKTVSVLDTEVAAKQQQAVMRDANELTRLVAELTRPYQPAMPVEIVMLDYYGREMEVWSAAKDARKLQATKTAIQSTWRQVRPQVVARGHAGQTEAHTFDKFVRQVERARSPADHGKIAASFLAEVDNVERVFKD